MTIAYLSRMAIVFRRACTLLVVFTVTFRSVDLQFGVYSPHMFPPPIYPPPAPMIPMAAPMAAPMPMMSPFLISVEKTSSEEKTKRNKTMTTTTTNKPKKKKELALAFPVPVAMPFALCKAKPAPKPKVRLPKPKKAYAVPVPMAAPAPVVAPSPIIVAPIAAPAPPPRRPWGPRPRPRWSSDSSFSQESSDTSSSDSRYRRRRRYRHRKDRNIYRRNLRSSESDNELIKPMLSYIADNGDVKFETKISNDDVAELLGEKEIGDRRSETVHVYTRDNEVDRPKLVVQSKNNGPQNFRQGRQKQIFLRGGISNHVLGEGKKELIFTAPDDKKISNLSLSFQIS